MIQDLKIMEMNQESSISIGIANLILMTIIMAVDKQIVLVPFFKIQQIFV